MPRSTDTDLLIIGAGPFGIATAAYAGQRGLDYAIVGEPMAFWREQMPQGMLLRSASDWHLDVTGEHTIEAYLTTRGLTPADVEPLTRNVYLDHCDWFIREKRIDARRAFVRELRRGESDDARFDAVMEDGDVVRARNVVIAVGMGYFANVPAETASLLPDGRSATRARSSTSRASRASA
jgi:cation diffusion facilitator CzcD-associated flavoprotein CzcO